MEEKPSTISKAFQVFMTEAPQHAQLWGRMVQELSQASALDARTQSLAYLAVLAAMRLESGIPFHVRALKEMGVSRDEVISAIMVGLPAVGHVVTQALPAAIAAYDSD
jgi:alkylhydroperoxidase/carboxymuconolactone decarboxylase family protein YurZ